MVTFVLYSMGVTYCEDIEEFDLLCLEKFTFCLDGSVVASLDTSGARTCRRHTGTHIRHAKGHIQIYDKMLTESCLGHVN